MEEHMEANENGSERGAASSAVNRWLLAAGVALIVVAGVAFGYGYRQQVLVGHLTAQQSIASATINDMQGQVATLTAKLNEMSAAQQAAAQAAAQKRASAGAARAKTPSGKSSTPPSKHPKETPARPAEHQKPLTPTPKNKSTKHTP